MGVDFSKYDIFRAFWTTIQLTVFSAIGALILGTVLAAMRLSPVPMLLNWIGTTYVDVVRNTPLTLIVVAILMITVNFALSTFGVWLERRLRRSSRAPTPLAAETIEQEGAPGARVEPAAPTGQT